MVDNKRKCSVGLFPPLSLPPSPPGPYLKYLEVDGGTSLLEAVSCSNERGLSGVDRTVGSSILGTTLDCITQLGLVHFSHAAVKLP